MHPAPSVIVFTTLSGFGFGLMFWLGMGATQADGMFAFTFTLLAGLPAVIGLLASTFHLGNPQRALKAFTQWRSSWLSREGVVSVFTLICFALYALLWVFFDTRVTVLGWLAALGALATIFCTAMIYAQLRTVPRWNTALTPLLFTLYALALPAMVAMLPVLAMGYLIALIVVQILHWRRGDEGLAGRGHSPESATGLGSIGQVRLLEAPHSGPNYLMNEMVFKVGRHRARQLRHLTLIFGFAVPILVLLLWLAGPFSHWLILLAALSQFAGTVFSRWLFFAEAEHAVSLYYGHR